jgi:hypothetical protein
VVGVRSVEDSPFDAETIGDGPQEDDPYRNMIKERMRKILFMGRLVAG